MSVRWNNRVPNVSPKTVIPTVPLLKTVPYALQDVRLSEGKWEECGLCPLSIANRVQKVDLTPRKHDHMVALDEALLHYIFDRQAYVKLNQAPSESPLGKWRALRGKEGRLFVAKPPAKPPSSEPWRYDSPPKLGFVNPGWRAWDPNDVALTISEVNSEQEYQEHLETFFLWLNIVGVMKSEMMETAEAWMLACGEETDHLKVKNRRTCKIDRCFVTCDLDFFELVMAKWDRMSFFTRSIKCGEKMKYMRRLMDIRMDPFSLPSEPETSVDPCEARLMIQGHPLCNVHGQYPLRRSIRTAPVGVHRTKLLSPRARPKTRGAEAGCQIMLRERMVALRTGGAQIHRELASVTEQVDVSHSRDRENLQHDLKRSHQRVIFMELFEYHRQDNTRKPTLGKPVRYVEKRSTN